MSDALYGYADRRWNPITGCSARLQCRDRCWARSFAHRHRGRFGYPADDPFRPTCHADRLEKPLHWMKRNQIVAVSFMGDLFDRELQPDFVVEVMIRMERSINRKGHRFLVLTKQADIMADFLQGIGVSPSPNIWWGVSVENRDALHRIDDLRSVPSPSRWISLEPQIEDVGMIDLSGIGWVVQGCESGPRRRPFDLSWARSVRDACATSSVPYFLKQIQARRCEAGGDCKSQCLDTRKLEQCVSRDDVWRAPILDGARHAAVPWPG